MSVMIGRHVGGITLNEVEYSKDENGILHVFETDKLANQFLISNGFTQQLIDDTITFREIV